LETEYLGFILTREGIKPQQQKVNAILQVAPPRNVKQVQCFVGMLNHYKAMIPHRSHLLTPLMALTKKNVKFEWTKEHQQAFDLLKNSFAHEVVLAYPDFFEIYTDASKYQIGSVITQKDKPLAFHSRKLTDPQTRYTVTELELLAIVETLREYKCILLGHLITIYMDHKNLTFSNFTTNCVTHWQLIVEDYGPKIVYLPGKCNIIANALSRLPKLNDPHDESTFLEEIFALDEQTDAFPIAFDVISKAQLADNKIQRCITNNDPDFETRNNPTSTIGILQRKNHDPYQPLLLHTHLVSQKSTSSRFRPHVSYNISTFHLAQPTHTSRKLCQTLQHLPTLQDTNKEVWTHTCSGQATNR
jgi:hypothetical protein